jgi:transposase-like protein
MYRTLHPSATAGRGQRLGQTSRFKCKMCGFWVNARERSNRAQENVADGMNITGTGATIELDAAAGCPLCGTFNWSSNTSAYFQKRSTRPGFKPATYRRRYARF